MEEYNENEEIVKHEGDGQKEEELKVVAEVSVGMNEKEQLFLRLNDEVYPDLTLVQAEQMIKKMSEILQEDRLKRETLKMLSERMKI